MESYQELLVRKRSARHLVRTFLRMDDSFELTNFAEVGTGGVNSRARVPYFGTSLEKQKGGDC